MMWIVFILIIALIFFFSIEKFPPDAIVLVAIIILVVTKVIKPDEAFKGFGSDFIVMLSSIFIMSAVLQHNGVIEHFSNKLADRGLGNYFTSILLIMLPVGLLSAFMNNTTIAAVMVLPVISMCKKTNRNPSHYLMPMAFASLLGGTCTLIGTSTNVAGNSFLVENGMQQILMFEFFPIGITLLIVCSIIFAVFGKYLLPIRINNDGETEDATNRIFYSSFTINEGNIFYQKKVLDILSNNAQVTKLLRNNNKLTFDNNTELLENDVVFISASKEKLIGFENNISKSLLREEDAIIELMVLPSSFIAYQSMASSQFSEITQLKPIAIFRKNYNFQKNIEDVVVKVGDIIITKGTEETKKQVISSNDFIILNKDEVKTLPANFNKGLLGLVFFIIAIALGSINIIPISIAFLTAVIVTLSFNVLPADAIYSSVNWRLIILIGGMSAFGIAIKNTGGDVYLANQIAHYFSGSSPLLILFIFMVLTVLLTQPMSNAAAALVVLPIALQTAQKFGANPRAFAIAIILSASISMVTPFEPASLLVLNPGKYKIVDFLKIGGMLTLICLIIILFMINKIYSI